MSQEKVEVIVDAGTPSEQMEAIATSFRNVGLDANVRDSYLRLGAGDLPFQIVVYGPVAWLAVIYATGFVQKAGEDSWDAFRDGGWRGLGQFVREMFSARKGRDGTLKVQDPTGPDLILDPTIPDQALVELANLDWGAMDEGALYWNPSLDEWEYVHHVTAPKGAKPPRR